MDPHFLIRGPTRREDTNPIFCLKKLIPKKFVHTISMIVVVISDCHLSWYRKIHSRYTYVCLWKTKNIHRTIILNIGNFLKKYSILTSKPMATSHLLDLNTTCMWVMSANLTQAKRCVPDSTKMLIQLDSHLYLFHWGQLTYSIWTCRCIHSISFEYHFLLFTWNPAMYRLLGGLDWCVSMLILLCCLLFSFCTFLIN